MRIKKILAAVLAASILLTSGSFTALAAPGEAEGGVQAVTGGAVAGEPEDKPLEDNTEKTSGSHGAALEIAPDTAAEGFQVTDGVLTAVSAGAITANLVIPDGVTKIADGLFRENHVIEKVTLPDGLEEIGSAVFEGCERLEEINFPLSVKKIGSRAFLRCISLKGAILKENLESIGEAAFENCSSLRTITIPKKIQQIEKRTFYNCNRLIWLNLPEGLRSIGEEAFARCTALSGVVFPEKLKVIAAKAFLGCVKIKKITIPRTLEVLGENSFASCLALQEVDLSKKLYLPSDEDTTSQIVTSGDKIHPNAIGDSAFEGCTSLLRVKFGQGYEAIGQRSFYGCYSLMTADLPQEVRFIKREAFEACSKMVTAFIRNNGTRPSERLQDFGLSAFPANKGMKLYGYEGPVSEYVNKINSNMNSKVLFFVNIDKITQNDTYLISIDKDAALYGKIEAYIMEKDENGEEQEKVITSSKKGESIKVKVQPKDGYTLKGGSLRVNGEPVSNNAFEMPVGDVVITAEFVKNTSGAEILDTKIEYVLKDYFPMKEINGKQGIEMKAGQSTEMAVWGVQSIGELESSKLTFSSSNTNILTISSNGVIKAKKKGTAMLTVKITAKPSVKLELPVQITDAKIVDIKFKSDADDTRFAQESEEDGTMVIICPESKIGGSKKTVNVTAIGMDEEGTELEAAYNWTVKDTKVAEINSAAGDNVDVTFQGAGVTTLTATVKDGSKEPLSKTVIIRVTDNRPRFSAESLNINLYQGNGAELAIIPSYGYLIAPYELVLYEDAAKSERSKYFDIEKAAGENMYQVSSVSGAEESLESNASYTAYLYGIAGEDTEFMQKLTIKVTRKKPNPSIKLTGKINTFYTAGANNELENYIKITNNYKDGDVSYHLEPLTDSENAEKEEAYRLFTDNFELTKKYDDKTKEWVDAIVQKRDVLAVYQNKPVVTGYLCVSFEGYGEDAVLKKKITVPTAKTKPAYKLSMTKATVYSSFASGQEITVQLLDSKNKNQAVALQGFQATYREVSNGKLNVFEGNGPEMNAADNTMTMRVSGIEKGKTVIRLEHPDWAEHIDYAFNLSLTEKAPKASLSPNTITLNANFPEQEAATLLKLNQATRLLADNQVFEPIPFSAKVKDSEEKNANLQKITVTYDEVTNAVSASAISQLKAGTYKFKCTVNEGSEYPVLNTVTLTIKVTSALPDMKPAGTGFQINRLTENDGVYETVRKKVTRSKEAKVGKLDREPIIEPVNDSAKMLGADDIYFYYSEETVEDAKKGAVTTEYLNATLKKAVNPGSYKFKITPSFEGDVNGKARTFTVKVTSNKAPTVTILQKKGSINPVLRAVGVSDGITFIPKVNNCTLSVSAGAIRVEEIVNGRPVEVSTNFTAESFIGEKDKKLYTRIRAIEGAPLQTDVTYTLYLYYQLAETGAVVKSSKLTFKPVQKLPEISLSKETLNLYAANLSYTDSTIITQKTNKDAKITAVEWDSGVSDTIKEAFELREYDADSGKLTIGLKNPALVPMNSVQNLKIRLRIKDEAANLKGKVITVKVKVNR